MKAITVNVDEKNSLKLEDVQKPLIGPEEVLIAVRAAALNHRDLYMNEQWQALKGYGTFIAGGDASGVIVETGSSVAGWKEGDEVIINPQLTDEEDENVFPSFLGGPTDGTFAEFVKAPASFILKKPEYLTFEEAAAVPLALSTAWGNTTVQGKLEKGETLLLQGIGGGVATFILQLAVRMGVNVIVTSSSDAKIEKAKQLGAIHGINYKKENVAEKVMEFTQGKGADAVIDGNGKGSIESSIQSLSDYGRLLLFGSSSGPIEKEQIENVNYLFTGMVAQADLEAALSFYEEYEIRPIMSQRVYSIEEYKEAYEELKEGRQFGKIVFKMN